MSPIEPLHPVVGGRITADGLLAEADPWLADLNARAGGTIGAMLALPQLAEMARLVRRLGTPLSRGLIVADGERDIDLWARAEPDASDAIRVELTGWRERPAWTPGSQKGGLLRTFTSIGGGAGKAGIGGQDRYGAARIRGPGARRVPRPPSAQGLLS